MHKTVLLLLLGVALAGCASSPDSQEFVDKETYDLGTLGGIAGLLVDDRYRPIDLEPSGAAGEFQSIGFILLQETGKQVLSSENGEFQFLNLEPGKYTLRFSIENHEAVPQTVQVVAGEFVEVNTIARRISSAQSTLLTTEYAVFMECAVTVIVALTFSCGTDQSGDSDRAAFVADYTQYPDARALIAEMSTSQEKRFEVDLWWPDGEDIPFYANDVFTGTYLKMPLRINETNNVNEAIFTNDPWLNNYPIRTEVLVYGNLAEEGSAIDPFFTGGGVGVHLAVKAQFLHSLFLGELPVDIDNYCVLCPI